MRPEDVHRLNAALTGVDADIILNVCEYAFRKPVLATSGGPNSGMLWHMVHKRFGCRFPAVFVNPGDVPPENLRYLAVLARRYPLALSTHEPDPPATAGELEMIAAGGEVRLEAYERTKHLTLRLALQEHGADCVIFGARADQSGARDGRLKLLTRCLIARTDGRTGAYPNYRKTNQDTEEYCRQQGIPFHEFGPPGGERIECGIHT